MGYINEVTILVWIVCGIGSFLIAQNRGATNAPTWFLVGVLLGPLGLLLAAIGARGKGKRQGAVEQLRGLAQLKAEGHLSEQEYEAKKRELLGRV